MGKPSTFESDMICADQVDNKVRELIGRSYILSNDSLDFVIDSIEKIYKDRDKLLYKAAIFLPRFYILKMHKDIDGAFVRDDCNKFCNYCYQIQCSRCKFGMVILDPFDSNRARCYCYVDPTRFTSSTKLM